MAMNNPDLFDDEATDDSMSSSGQSAEVYVVEKIIRRRFNATENIFEYELKWKGYPDSENTWEPESSLKCDFLLKEFNEKRERRKERKILRQKRNSLILTEEDKKFVVSDNESLSHSSWSSGSGNEDKKKELKRNKSIRTSSSACKRRSKSVKRSERRMSQSKPRLQGKKKKLGEILSYDDVPSPAAPVEEDELMDPCTSTSIPSKKIKKEAMCQTPIQKKKKKLKPEDVQMKKEQLPNSSPAPPEEKAAEQRIKKVSEELRLRLSRSKSSSREPECHKVQKPQQSVLAVPPTTAVEEEEEESDTNFELDLNKIPYKVIEEDAENGFDRGWEVERILVLISDDSPETQDARARKYAIVKFKGFKYSHRILLTEVKARAPKELSAFLREKMSVQLQARSLKRSDWHERKG
uniref:Chromo domain-containing protein n=1 Tax=Ditylenchus dipsaci TaxID=166011 RepID=A0A915DDB0_9BILA